MSTELTKEIVQRFCQHCDWAHQCWLLRKHLYDENPEQNLLRHPEHRQFFVRLEKILQEYWIHEVTKLHDPAKQNGNFNLSIEYVLKHGAWTEDDRIELEKLKATLDDFSKLLRPARHKLLSHKDIPTILSGESMGSFAEGEDVKYFDALQSYAGMAHRILVGQPYLFDGLTGNDVEVFVTTFSLGCLAGIPD